MINFYAGYTCHLKIQDPSGKKFSSMTGGTCGCWNFFRDLLQLPPKNAGWLKFPEDCGNSRSTRNYGPAVLGHVPIGPLTLSSVSHSDAMVFSLFVDLTFRRIEFN